MIEYVGNAPYCYANSAAMLLKSIDENIPPGKIEVLTGVGLGAIWQDDGLFWLSNPYSPPDIGLSAALGILGFQFVEGSIEAPDPCPLEELEKLLQIGDQMNSKNGVALLRVPRDLARHAACS